MLDEAAYAGGWRSAQLDGDLRGALKALVAETGGSALSAFNMDGDVADVEALSPGGAAWHVYLHEETALGYGAPELSQSTDEVIGQAQAWSAEAGLTSSAGALRAAIEGHNVFAEESFYELLDALGVSKSPAE